MEKGFYKADIDLLFAPNKVQHKDFILEIANKDTYSFPVHGWHYFDTREEAETFFTGQGWEAPQEPEPEN